MPFDAGAALPPLWHRVCFTPNARAAELGAEGDPPPVDRSNRMRTGGRRVFAPPLRIGDDVQRISRSVRCERKRGRAGELVFVTAPGAAELWARCIGRVAMRADLAFE